MSPGLSVTRVTIVLLFLSGSVNSIPYDRPTRIKSHTGLALQNLYINVCCYIVLQSHLFNIEQHSVLIAVLLLLHDMDEHALVALLKQISRREW